MIAVIALLSPVSAFLAFIFGIIGLLQKDRENAFQILGIVLSILGFIFNSLLANALAYPDITG